MCRIKLITTRLLGSVCASAFVGIAAARTCLGAALAVLISFAANYAIAQVNSPPGCNANTLAINIAKFPINNITSGTVVQYTLTLQNFSTDQAGNPGCDIQIGPSGLLFHCPAADGGSNGPASTLLPSGFIIAAGSPPLIFTNFCTVTVNPGVTSATALLNAPDAILLDGFNDSPSLFKPITISVVTPCIRVTKQCVNTCTPYGQPIQFSGTVTNCGNIQLTNVTVTDDHAGVVLGPVTLTASGTPGSSATFSGQYTPAGSGTALCGPFTDTVTAVGTAGTQPTVTTVTNTASATCPVCNNPCVQVTKICPSITTINLGSPSYTVSGSVTNCGNVPLVNVVVTDNITNADGTHTAVTVTNIASLGIGQSVQLPPQTITPTICGPSTD